MRKTEIQSLVPFILRCHNVLLLLLFCHRIPFLVSRAILEYVKGLREEEPQDHDDIDDDQAGVSAMVERLVLDEVDVRGDDVAELYAD